ncbi:hypothetical protein [Streptomyces sp. MP131-18]|uniref:hypothetical protein n=1 Tax=Streptomyces sp. MP131-18 TaxID=1857892 RepID=UPI00097C85D4|nr:hypothetical protein [Streptomyces sp. MP131-18]ONK13253.1 hypothetical protein STBA_40160 [Streptomyces sp. MP131-18]
MTLTANAVREGLGDLWAIWEVTFYEANPDGEGRKPSGHCWVTTLEAHPRHRQRSLAHQVWLYLNRWRPDVPEVDMLSPHVRLSGYCDPQTRARTHGVRCISCGSDQVTFTPGQRAECACGAGQTPSEAQLCTDPCNECEEKAL